MKKITQLSLIFVFILTISISSCTKDELAIGSTIYINEDIKANTLWEAKYTYIIEQSIDITNDATLTIEPGTLIKFKAGKYMTVSYSSSSFGNIKALGTAAKPIIFTSNAVTKNKGDWAGIWLYDGCNASEFRYCTFEYAGGDGWSGGDGGITINGGKNASIENCTFKNSASYGFRSYSSPGAISKFNSNTFLSNDVNDVKVYAYNLSSLGTNNSYEKKIDVYGTDINTIGDVSWKNQNTDLIIAGDIRVGSAQGTKLILEPGTTLKFGANGELGVGYSSTEIGLIEAIGTSINPITFTTSSNYPSNGDWDGIWFYGNSTAGSIFDHCVISYGGGYSSSQGNVVFKNGMGPNVTIQNSEISHSEGYGLLLDSGSDTNYPTLSNNTFIGNTIDDKNW